MELGKLVEQVFGWVYCWLIFVGDLMGRNVNEKLMVPKKVCC